MSMLRGHIQHYVGTPKSNVLIVFNVDVHGLRTLAIFFLILNNAKGDTNTASFI